MSLNSHEIKIKSIRAIKNHVLVSDMNFSQRLTTGGIILPDDNRKTDGIRPRWAKVVAVGPMQKDITVGQYIMVAHGRWTRGISVTIDGEEQTIRRVDNNDILLVSDNPQNDDTMSTAIGTTSDRSRIEGSMHNHDSW